MNNNFCYNHPIQTGSREFTHHNGSKSKHDKDLMKRFGIKSVYDFNHFIDNHGLSHARGKITSLENSVVCKANNKTVLYADSSDFHKRFEEMHKNIRTQKLKPHDRNNKHNKFMKVADVPNYSSKYVTESTN